MLWLLFQLAPPPSIPPPPADSLAAAVALWNEHPVPEAQKRQAIEGVVSGAVTNALLSAGIDTDSRRWPEKFEVLRTRLVGRLPRDMTRVEQTVTICLADPIAHQFSVAEIAELRRYAATSGGEKFWQMVNWNTSRIIPCYQAALDIRLSRDDYRAAGLKPPEFERSGNIVS